MVGLIHVYGPAIPFLILSFPRTTRQIMKQKVYTYIYISILILSSLFLSRAGAEEINPESYRGDYYKMPINEELEKKALLRDDLNWKVPGVASAPVAIMDREGNITVYQGGKRRYSISKDGTVTYYTNNVKTAGKRRLEESGELYLFRTYQQGDDGRLSIFNEWGDKLGEEEYGLDDKLMKVYDSYGNLANIFEYDNEGYWMFNLINRTWTRYEEGLPKEQRLGSKDGVRIAHWEEGTHFGISGLWKVEIGWDGEQTKDMFYTLYNEFADEEYEMYHVDGYLIRSWSWKDHRMVRSEHVTHFRYGKYGDFGATEEGDIWYGEDSFRWEGWTHNYLGSQLVSAVRTYADEDYYDERIFDLNGNIDKVLRIDENTGETLVVLEDSVYFYEVVNLSLDEMKEFFNLTSDEVALYLYEKKEELKAKDKALSSFFGVYNGLQMGFTVYDEYNKPLQETTLIPLYHS